MEQTMILLVCNESLSTGSGFAIRALREIRALSSIDSVGVICRQGANEKKVEIISGEKFPITLYRFSIMASINERPGNVAIWYELKRNVLLMKELLKTLIYVMNRHEAKNIRVWAVSSPLTVPFLTSMVAIWYKYRLWVMEMHDLEPELAMHMKGYVKFHPVMLIEYVLECINVWAFEKVVVTTIGQKDRIIGRTRISSKKIHASPNTVVWNEYLHPKIRNNNFTCAYVSSLTYPFTVTGIVEVIHLWAEVVKKIPHARLLIAGSGHSAKIVEEAVKNENMNANICLLGHIPDVMKKLTDVDVMLIPWKEDIMTQTMLPTKYFTYIAAGKVVVAPKFGEFTQVIHDGIDGLLYDGKEDFINILVRLHKDPHKRGTISHAAISRYQTQFTPQIVSEALLAFVTQ